MVALKQANETILREFDAAERGFREVAAIPTPAIAHTAAPHPGLRRASYSARP